MSYFSELVRVLACFVVLAGLSTPNAVAEKPVVGLVMKSLANEFFKVMEEGARKFAEEDGSFKLIAVGMNSETDIDTQVAAMENFISQKVDVIAIAPADSVGMVASVKKAVKAGIVVVNFDVTLNKKALTEAGLDADFLFVGPDNADGAELVGDHLGQTLGKNARVIIVEGNPGADNAKLRKAGFMRSVKRYDLQLLASRTAHWEVEEANTLMSNLIVMYPDVQGVMCANDSMAIGVEKALTAARRKDVLIVGFDNVPAVQKLIKQGRVLSTVDQFGPEMASNAIKVGLRILKGEKLKGWIKTPVEIVKKGNL